MALTKASTCVLAAAFRSAPGAARVRAESFFDAAIAVCTEFAGHPLQELRRGRTAEIADRRHQLVLRRNPVAVVRQLRDPVKGRRPPRHPRQATIVHGEAIEPHRPGAASVEYIGQRVAQFGDVIGHPEHEAADASHAHARERQGILAVDSEMRFGVQLSLVLRRRRRAQFGAGFGKRRRRVFRHFRPRRIEKRLLAEALRRKLDDQVREGVRARPL
jgi:hypothetical protein